MKAKTVFGVLVMCLFLLTGCGSNNTADYDSLIDNVIEYSNDNVSEGDYDYFEREASNFIVWEDENNYYILMRKNYIPKGNSVDDDPQEEVYSERYQIGKVNNRISDDLSDVVIEFYQTNEPPLYTEDNIELSENSRYIW